MRSFTREKKHQYSSSLHCTVVNDILTADILKLRSFVSHYELSGHPISPVVGRRTILDMSNILLKNPDNLLQENES